jgi:hypothetical protein
VLTYVNTYWQEQKNKLGRYLDRIALHGTESNVGKSLCVVSPLK